MIFQKTILSWYSKNKRDLPWRKTIDAYEILVSEIMLQQTQVDRVIPKYLAFLERFPTAKHLASSKTSDVLKLWSGLGYNRRAVNLQKAAMTLQDGVPEDLTELPGVGPYTSAAVSAFNKDVPVVDTNIRRIFSRVFFAGKGNKDTIDASVLSNIPQGQSRDWNNALMDFGSSICTASSPSCSSCPLKSSCSAFKAGTTSYFKIAPPQKKFAGSRRQFRGQVLKLLTAKEMLTFAELQKSLGKPKTFVSEIVSELEKEGMVVSRKDGISLP